MIGLVIPSVVLVVRIGQGEIIRTMHKNRTLMCTGHAKIADMGVKQYFYGWNIMDYLDASAVHGYTWEPRKYKKYVESYRHPQVTSGMWMNHVNWLAIDTPLSGKYLCAN